MARISSFFVKIERLHTVWWEFAESSHETRLTRLRELSRKLFGGFMAPAKNT
jgi:hypothetical protein